MKITKKYEHVIEACRSGKLSATKTVKLFCLDCVCFQPTERDACPDKGCPLWAYIHKQDGKVDFGDRSVPKQSNRLFRRCAERQATPLEHIRAKCLECVGYSSAEVDSCTDHTCLFYAYRQRAKDCVCRG